MFCGLSPCYQCLAVIGAYTCRLVSVCPSDDDIDDDDDDDDVVERALSRWTSARRCTRPVQQLQRPVTSSEHSATHTRTHIQHHVTDTTAVSKMSHSR